MNGRKQARYRRLFEGSSVAIWEQDWSAVERQFAALRPTDADDLEAMLGRDLDLVRHARSLIKVEVANQAAVDLVGAFDAESLSADPSRSLPISDLTVKNAFMAFVRRLPCFAAEGSVRSFKGGRVDVLLTIDFSDHSSSARPVLVSMVDVSRRKGAEQALLEAQHDLAHASRIATMGALTASITHELSQPLAAVIANSEASLRWLRHADVDVAEAKASVERILKSGRAASDIVRRTRAFLSRGGSEFEPISVSEVLSEAVMLLEREIAAHGVSLVQVVAPNLPEVTADRVQLQQVVVNLVVNAIDAMISSGRAARNLVLSANLYDHDQITVLVADNGSGVAPDQMDRLFEPLFTTKDKGMGLGLSICRTAVEAHGGQLWASSELGVGSIFHFTLPTNTVEARRSA